MSFGKLLFIATMTLAQIFPNNMIGTGGVTEGNAGAYSGATADYNFASGALFGAALTVSRASSDSEVCNGQLYTFGNNVAPITPCGLWAWESRTNTVYNSLFVGATASTPPAGLPLTWGFSGLPPGVTATQSAPTVDPVSGQTYLAFTFVGTPSATGLLYISFQGPQDIAALYGQTWTSSLYTAVPAGGVTNGVSYTFAVYGYTAGGSYDSNVISGSITPGTTLSSISAKQTGSATLISSTAKYIRPEYVVNFTSGQAVNFVLQIGVYQLELNPNLPASVASAVVASGGVCTPGTYTFTVAGGTGTAATISGTVTGTTLGGTLTVVTPGSYSAASGLPASPATLTGGVCTTQPTVTLTPTNNAASAFATGPILTSGTAATRAQNTITSSVGAYASSTVFAKMAPQSSVTSPFAQWAAAYGGPNGTGLLTPASAYTSTYAAGGSTYSMGLGSFAQATTASFGEAYGGGTENVSFNGATATASNSATPSGSTLYIGSNALGANACNCVIPRVAFFPNQLSTAQLGALQ